MSAIAAMGCVLTFRSILKILAANIQEIAKRRYSIGVERHAEDRHQAGYVTQNATEEFRGSRCRVVARLVACTSRIRNGSHGRDVRSDRPVCGGRIGRLLG